MYYCSKEHQIDDWKSHRGSCRYYKLIQEPSKRSYLVATRKIPKGTTILRSKAIVVGPVSNEVNLFFNLKPGSQSKYIASKLLYDRVACSLYASAVCAQSFMMSCPINVRDVAGQ